MYKSPPSLELLRPSFDSPLVGLIVELEKLRDKQLRGTTPPYVFFQLKNFFHALESLASARIEGNNTTVSELVEAELSLDSDKALGQSLQEINNMRNALDFIEKTLPHEQLSPLILREIHKMVVQDLTLEGDKYPGEYRKHNVSIHGSTHTPPDGLFVQELMGNFFDFLSRSDASQFDLIKIALAHHAFAWIHPFGNGNGRTVRLVTYAMLIKQQFNVQDYGRIINPAAIFCNDRQEYYNMLSKADEGTPEGLEAWCMYVLSGLKRETQKIDQLADFKWLVENIWLPALNYVKERKIVTIEEADVLKNVFSIRKPFKAQDLSVVYPGSTITAKQKRSYIIRKMQEGNLITKHEGAERSYVVNLSDKSPLLYGLSEALRNAGFIPQNLYEKF